MERLPNSLDRILYQAGGYVMFIYYTKKDIVDADIVAGDLVAFCPNRLAYKEKDSDYEVYEIDDSQIQELIYEDNAQANTRNWKKGKDGIPIRKKETEITTIKETLKSKAKIERGKQAKSDLESAGYTIGKVIP